MAFDIVDFAFLAALAAWFKVSSGMFSCVSMGVLCRNFMLVLNVRLSAPCCQPLGGFLLYRSARFFETGGFLQLTFAQLAEKNWRWFGGLYCFAYCSGVLIGLTTPNSEYKPR
jgi:hypothetical protein